MNYTIGIDAGTSNCKVILFDEDGYLIEEKRKASPVMKADNGEAVYPADEVWTEIAAMVREVTHKVGQKITDSVVGLAVTGMGEAGVPLDASGEALYPFIAWYDPRTIPYVDWWRKTFGEDRLLRITGTKPQHIFSVNKILWLKDNRPDIFAGMRHWACMEDFLAFRLTRRLKMDYSIGSRTMMMDIGRGSWSPEILARAGISENMLPELVPSGTLVGEVTAEAAQMTGLKSGTMVFTGGHDHVCGALASGIFADNVILDSSGTAEEVLTATRDGERLRLLGSRGFNVGRHVYGDLFYTAGGIPASGATMDWFGGVWPLTEQERRLKVAGAHGMMFMPHLRGSSTPTRDQKSKGAFLGLREYHTGSDFSQAVTEGLCYEFRQVALALLGDESPQKIVAIGGGTKNRDWIQTKADVMQAVIEIPQIQEATALGAALLAGIGAGLYKNAEDAVRRTYKSGQIVEPDPSKAELYARGFETYRELFTRLYPVNARL